MAPAEARSEHSDGVSTYKQPDEQTPEQLDTKPHTPSRQEIDPWRAEGKYEELHKSKPRRNAEQHRKPKPHSQSRKEIDPWRAEGKYNELNNVKSRRNAYSSSDPAYDPSVHHRNDYSSRLDDAYDPEFMKRDEYEDRLNAAYDPHLHHASTLLARDSARADSQLLPVPSVNDLISRSLPSAQYNPGQGSRNPSTINNKGFFALFALLGVGMVITSIWFFFWAKNGGFVWRKGDWDDYKSTVLRRKGPDGKTLSNATKTTMLGQKSIAGTFDIEKQDSREVRGYSDERRKQSRKTHGAGKRDPSDEDVRAYRQEKPARVGGLNRNYDGSHFDSAVTSRSDLMSEASDRPLYPNPSLSPPRTKGFAEHRRERRKEKKEIKQAQKTKDALRNGGGLGYTSRPSRLRRHSFSTVDDSVTDDSERQSGSNGNTTRDNYYSAYRPQRPRYESPQRQPPRNSYPAPPPPPTMPKQSRLPKHPGSFDAYSEAGDSDTGTKIYSHHIPGVSRPGRNGFRRGERRDSLSD